MGFFGFGLEHTERTQNNKKDVALVEIYVSSLTKDRLVGLVQHHALVGLVQCHARANKQGNLRS